MTLDGTCLVTGAAGQDGFILCRRLREMGAEVVGIARPGGAQAARSEALIETGCRIIDLDLENSDAIGEVVAAVKPAHIFHLAAAHHSSDSGAETAETWRAMLAVNLTATEALVSAAEQASPGASFVYASSSQIWTAKEPEQRMDETTPVSPASYYGRTKILATQLLHEYRPKLRTMTAILFNHESPFRSDSFVTRKITMAAARAARGDSTKLHLRNIGARVDWQAASDVVEGFLLMAKSQVPEDYVLASGMSHSVKDFAAIAFGHVGLDWQDFVVAERDEAGPGLIGVPEKAERKLGWQRQQSFEKIVRGMVDADRART